MPLRAPKFLRDVLPAGIAILALIGAVGAADAAAAPPVPTECRNATCLDVMTAGPTPTAWVSPQAFFPNNEHVFAAPAVGSLTLPEVRVYGPALCRHRFAGAGTMVVIKACGSQPSLRVRAWRLKRGVRTLRITYAARPLMDAGLNSSSSAAAPIFDQLHQITGLQGS